MLTASSISSGGRHRFFASFLRIFVLSLLIAAFAPKPAFADPTTSITQCGTIIDHPGHYVVANDLSCPFQNGIVIVADHVTLMLDNHQIAGAAFVGNGISVGVGVPSGNSHVHILGPGTITGFNEGINFDRSRSLQSGT